MPDKVRRRRITAIAGNHFEAHDDDEGEDVESDEGVHVSACADDEGGE